MSKKRMSEYECERFKSSTLDTINKRLSRSEKFNTFEEFNQYCSQFKGKNNGNTSVLQSDRSLETDAG